MFKKTRVVKWLWLGVLRLEGSSLPWMLGCCWLWFPVVTNSPSKANPLSEWLDGRCDVLHGITALARGAGKLSQGTAGGVCDAPKTTE